MSRQYDEQRFSRSSSSKGKPGPAGKDQPVWFFPFTPTKEQKVEIKALLSGPDAHLVDLLALASEQGYKVGIKWNITANAHQLTLTGLEDNDFNAGKCLAVYHSDMYTGLAILSYAVAHQFGLKIEWSKKQSGFDNDW